MKIKTQEELRSLYKLPSGRAKDKVLMRLEKHSIHYIESSPFMLLSTSNSKGKMDNSPRGGEPGFVKVLDETRILIPDARGNNRIDSLQNIVETGSIGTLFLIPGIDETLRLNGSAYISNDPELLSLFTSEKFPIISCIVIEIEEVFIHCAKAFMRSELWSSEAQMKRSNFPTIGQILKDQLKASEVPESQKAMVKRYSENL